MISDFRLLIADWRTAAVILALSLVGCVRIDDGGAVNPGPRVNVSRATAQAWRNHRHRLADFYDQAAERPPRSVTEWAEASVKAGEASEALRREEIAAWLAPLLEDEEDQLDPAKARRVFREIAKGLRQ